MLLWPISLMSIIDFHKIVFFFLHSFAYFVHQEPPIQISDNYPSHSGLCLQITRAFRLYNTIELIFISLITLLLFYRFNAKNNVTVYSRNCCKTHSTKLHLTRTSPLNGLSSYGSGLHNWDFINRALVNLFGFRGRLFILGELVLFKGIVLCSCYFISFGDLFHLNFILHCGLHVQLIQGFL